MEISWKERLYILSLKELISRNFCWKYLKVKFRHFHHAHWNIPTQHSISRKIRLIEKFTNFHTVCLFVLHYLNESSTNEGLLRPWLLQRLEAFYLAPKFLTHWIKRPREKKAITRFFFFLTEEQNLQKIFVSLPRWDSFNAKMCLRIWGNIHTIT